MKKSVKIICGGLCALALTASAMTAKTKYDANGDKVSFWKDLFVGASKYVEYDDVTLQTGTVFMQQKERNSTMIYNPKTQEAGLATYYQTMFFNFVFSQDERERIIKAVDSYLSDFENKRLIHNNNKSTKMYGTGKCFADFGTTKIMMNHEAKTTYKVGYRFEKKAPYFVISVQGAKDQAENQSEYQVKEFPTVTMYFTRAQAKDFAAKLNQDQLNVLQAEYDEKVNGLQNRIITEKEDYDGVKSVSEEERNAYEE